MEVIKINDNTYRITERKQEIGIRKALGASPSDIRQQFLIESASIIFVGVFFGLNPASRAAKLDPVIALSGE